MKSLGKPKPTKQTRKKKAKAITQICVACGEWWRGGNENEVHAPDCLHDLRVIKFNKRKEERQMVCEALDEICRLITTWRDGTKCVIHGDNGCAGPSQWGHVVPQGSCSFLVYELSNSFRQSAQCNELHRRVAFPYYDWYKSKWGETAYNMLRASWESAPKGGLSTMRLWEILAEYVGMYRDRYYVGTSTVELVRAGYYGAIIREAWERDGTLKALTGQAKHV